MQLNSELMRFRIGNEETIKQMPELSVDMPFAEGRIDFLNEISSELLKDKEAKRYPDVVTFAFWIRRANMEKEKEKYKSAISRLTDLYMFDPDALTKEEFSKRKREMTQKIQELTRQIIDLKENAGSGSADFAFIRKASAFLVAQRIASNEHIDYRQIAVDLDNKILKDFINQIIDKIFIQDGRIMKIRFASGLEHNFVYPD